MDADLSREWARLRALMMYPEKAWLVTIDGKRWLCDSYTLLHVSGSIALASDEGELPDGRYKLTAGKGLVSTLSAGLVAPEVAKLLKVVAGDDTCWLPCKATLWSVAESGAKAMLVYAVGDVNHEDDCLAGDCACAPIRYPLMVNEDVWKAFHDHYDRNKREDRTVRFEKDPGKPRQPFRVQVITTYTAPFEDEEVELGEVLAYVMPAKMPDGTWGGLPDAWKAAQYIVNEAILCIVPSQATM